MKLAPRPPRRTSRAPLTPPSSKPSFSFPSSTLLHSLFLTLFCLFLVFHLLPIVAFVHFAVSDSSAVWATLPFDLKLALSVRRVSWRKAMWGRGNSEDLERMVYDGMAWSAMVLWTRSGWGAHRVLLTSVSWTRATTAYILSGEKKGNRVKGLTSPCPSSLDVALFTLHTLSHHLVVLFLALSTLFGLTSWLSLLGVSLLNELAWIGLLVVVKTVCLVAGWRCSIAGKLARNSFGTFCWMIVCFL